MVIAKKGSRSGERAVKIVAVKGERGILPEQLALKLL